MDKLRKRREKEKKRTVVRREWGYERGKGFLLEKEREKE